ncbi:unnamed protein product [Eruca vesicaria subsp. sativa]|uniref:Endoglucanase n=1 Tax=Eruca vesicaria subsp. sativa TaxID=29727 RepID=A0ABC8KNF6_ERUVS|nr:unnamed protein product [Eruca vesicaria subsp. sativa]
MRNHGEKGRGNVLIKAILLGLISIVCVSGTNINYKEALTKSLIFLEAQRSGKLPSNNRVPWRGDSALDDGKLANVDLAGGYYDAGDNVKYGLPMAFTITTLAWSTISYEKELRAAGELENARAAIRWGTDYFLKCASRKNRLYVQVGDPHVDHKCWARPENMQTPRTVLQISDKDPGTEIAAETAAAFAASSIVFRRVDHKYSRRLLNKAKLLFKLAKSHKGTYDGECPFYCSCSGYNDELLWAATWLYKATRKEVYLSYLKFEAISGYVAEFSWDLKYAGAQMLISLPPSLQYPRFYVHIVTYIFRNMFIYEFKPLYSWCIIGGMIHLRDGANTQYVTATAFLFSSYADILQKYNQKIFCGSTQFDSAHLMAFAKKQIDYILGHNPKGRSYMVGFGPNPPKQAHHRGASVPISEANAPLSCPLSFVKWFNKNQPNANELTGAILGGPDRQDNFQDFRWTSVYTEPCTYINSIAVGILAKLAATA